MIRFIKENWVFLFFGVTSLILGTLIYILYRPNTFLSDCFRSFPLPRKAFSFFDAVWVKYYFVDYLWAFSLCCGLHTIFRPRAKGSLFVSVVSILYGGGLELLQSISILAGTGDYWDVLMFILAALTVNMINFIIHKEKKHEKAY